MLIEFLFEQEQMVDLFTEDPVYQFDTISKEFLSIRVGERKEGTSKRELLLYSLTFVMNLMEQRKWDYTKTYHIYGEYVEKYNAVVFFLKNATSK